MRNTKTNINTPHKAFWFILRSVILVLSVVVGYACVIGSDDGYDTKNLLIIFFFLSMLPFFLTVSSLIKGIVHNRKCKKKASGLGQGGTPDGDAADVIQFNLGNLDAKEQDSELDIPGEIDRFVEEHSSTGSDDEINSIEDIEKAKESIEASLGKMDAAFNDLVSLVKEKCVENSVSSSVEVVEDDEVEEEEDVPLWSDKGVDRLLDALEAEDAKIIAARNAGTSNGQAEPEDGDEAVVADKSIDNESDTESEEYVEESEKEPVVKQEVAKDDTNPIIEVMGEPYKARHKNRRFVRRADGRIYLEILADGNTPSRTTGKDENDSANGLDLASEKENQAEVTDKAVNVTVEESVGLKGGKGIQNKATEEVTGNGNKTDIEEISDEEKNTGGITPATVENSEEIWWDREKVNKYMSSNPEFQYSEPFGRIFLDTLWFVDGNTNDPVVMGYIKEIEKRGGRVNSVVSGGVTHYLGTESRDPSGFYERMARKYESKILFEDEFKDIVSIAECTDEKNKWMFTPAKLFKVNKEALAILEEEDNQKYLFLHIYGDKGLIMTWLGDDKEKKTIIWNGEDTEHFWAQFGDFFQKCIIVTPMGKERALKRLDDSLAVVGLRNIKLRFVEMTFIGKSVTRHESKEDLADMKYAAALFGQTPPRGEKEMSDAVCAVFMTYIIDHDKSPLEYLSFYTCGKGN